MTLSLRLSPSIALLALTLTSTATAQCSANKLDIVETAVKAGSFKTLATALEHTGLVSALQGEGPFTVFAPTDAAFAKLPAGTLQHLLEPENKDALAGILEFHVASGQLNAKHVAGRSFVETLQGQRIGVESSDGVRVAGARVVKADIQCSNGVIHVIDEVILPSSDSILATAAKAGTFKTLTAAIKAAGLADVLSGPGPFTVFAPTDAAFAKLPEGTVASLLEPENKAKLVQILKLHVVPGRIYSDQALAAGKAKSIEGAALRIAVVGGEARVNDAKLSSTDIQAGNGVIHVIDSVLLPETRVSSRTAPSGKPWF